MWLDLEKSWRLSAGMHVMGVTLVMHGVGQVHRMRGRQLNTVWKTATEAAGKDCELGMPTGGSRMHCAEQVGHLQEPTVHVLCRLLERWASST